MEQIRPASIEDVKKVGELYDMVNAFFEKTVNYCYPNWQKGKYPTIVDAKTAFHQNALYVMEIDGVLAASITINREQHPEYQKIPWSIQVDNSDNRVMVIHTLVVNPLYRNKGFGEKMVRFGIQFCQDAGAETIRMDTHYANVPARNLYKKCGFQSLGCWEALVDDIVQKFDVFEYVFET